MISCGKARALLVEHARGKVPEAVLLQLDVHLGQCAECRRERARWQTVGALGRWEPPGLSGQARERIARRLGSLVAEKARAPERPRRAPLWLGLAAAGATTLLGAAWLETARPPRADRVAAPSPGAARAEAVPARDPLATRGSVIRGERPGALRFLGAELAYRAGTVAELQPEAHRVSLASGELEVTRRAAQGELRVQLPRFAVIVRDGRAVFAADRVQVLEGEVIVFSLDERELARVAAGHRYPELAPASEAAPATGPGGPMRPSGSPSTAAQLAAGLDHARTALAAGDAPRARRLLAQLIAAEPPARARAEAELLGAESWLVAGEPERALAAYREVAGSWPRLPQGEAAAFAAAEILHEAGRTDEAQAALRAYLSLHPEGRFASEARERLAR